MSSFVGSGRRELVLDLFQTWRDVASGGGPRLVTISAPIGWGKTRLVHELYAEMAAAQPKPHYWPSRIDAHECEPLTSRKLTHPDGFKVNHSAEISFFWWGISCDVRPDGRRAQVLVDDSTQVMQHRWSIEALSNSRLRRALAMGDLDSVDGLVEKGSLVFDVVSAFGVALPPVAAARSVVEGTSAALEIVRRFRSDRRRSRELSSDRLIDAEDVGRIEFVDNLSSSISRLSQDRLPFFIFLDDAHYADTSVLSFVDNLLGIPENRVMVVCLTWPEELKRLDSPFGSWLAETERTRFGLVDRLELDALEPQDLAQLVTEVAPATSAEVVEAFVRRFMPNPFALRQALSFRSVESSIFQSAIEMTVSEVEELESELADQYKRKWAELPAAVREALVVSAELGSTYVEECSAQAAVALAVEHAVEALAQSTDVFGWSVDLDEWVDAFVERDLHGLAKSEWRKHFRPSDALLVRTVVADYIEQRRQTGAWVRMSRLARRTLLEAVCENQVMGDKSPSASRVSAALELAEIYEDEGRFNEARDVLDGLLGLGSAAVGSAWMALVLRAAELHLLCGAPRRCLELLDQLASDGPQKQSFVVDLLRAQASADSGDYETARRLAVALVTNSQPVEAFERSSLLVRLAAEQGLFSEAYDEGLEMVDQAERAFGVPSPEHLRALNLLAWTASRSRRHSEALALAEQAVTEAAEAVSTTHPDFLEAKNNLARFAHRAGDTERAAEIGREVVDARRRVLGGLHHKTLTSADNLAVYLEHLGDIAKAVDLTESTLEGWSQTLGLDHPKSLPPQVHRIRLATKTGQAEDVAADAIDVLLAHERILGPAHGNSLNAAEVALFCITDAGREDLRESVAEFRNRAVAAGVSRAALGSLDDGLTS